MSEIVADWVKDPAGIWWLLGVKAFKLEVCLIIDNYLLGNISQNYTKELFT